MKRVIILFMTAIFLIASGIGIYYKQSYPDIRKSDNPMKDFGIAPMRQELLEAAIQRMDEELGDSKHICLVKALGEIQYDFNLRKQLVEIEKIYQGSDVKTGDKIYITKDSLITSFDDMTMNMGFVNYMEKDEEYLVFFEEEIHSPWKDDYPVFVCADYLLFPVFALNNMEEKIPEMSEETFYIPYCEVADNEYFFREQISFETINNFKKRIFDTYMK